MSGPWKAPATTPRCPAKAREPRAAARVVQADAPSEIRTEPLPAGRHVGGYNNFWFDRGARVVADRRTSLIVDPPNSRIPDLTADGGAHGRARLTNQADPRRFNTWVQKIENRQ